VNLIIPDFSPPPTAEPKPSEALEQAAKAVAEVMARRRPGGTMLPWHCSAERTEALEYVRAALAALRAPTEEMMQAGMNAGQAPLCDGEIRQLWETLIDAALNPEPADA
jgi:hypothetical protein